MSQTDRQHCGAASRLSAEAQSFVPGQSRQLNADGTKSGGDDLSQLPRYITSCYPFVKEDQAHSARASCAWHGPGRPPSSWQGGGGGKRMSPSHSQPGMHNFPRPRANLRPAPGPRLAFPRSGPPPPGFIPRGVAYPPRLPTPALHGMPPYFPAGYQQMAIPHGWLPPAGSWDYAAPYGPRLFGPPPSLDGSGEGVDYKAKGRTKSAERNTKRKKNDSGGMVSIGIQNESGVQRSGSTTSKKKAKPRTLMCMDAAIQTDFSDEIANLTLMEKPSLLYRRDRSSTRSWFQRYSQTSSTDSDEVDSDSGYSSPLHRRNQMSNGTHPIAAGMPLLRYPMAQSNPVLMDSVTGYNPYVMANQVVNYAYANSQAVPYTDGYQYVGYRLPAPGVLHLNPGAGPYSDAHKSPVKSTVKAKNDSSKVPQPDVVIPEDKPVVLAPQSPRKRRRSRKKKKKSDDDDAEALSDEPRSLHQALSSSNVSHSSTVENEEALHFEDDEEFPDLLTSTGYGASGSGRGTANILSYSDILKNQAPPASSRESSISSSNRCMGPATSGSASGDGRRSNCGKDAKTARRRRKRHEMASRAADEELAEITLEQQVLKEMSAKSQKEMSAKTRKQQQQNPDKEPPKMEPEPVHAPVPAPVRGPATVMVPAPRPVSLPPGTSKQAMSLSIADMIFALEEKQQIELEKELEEEIKEKEPVKKSQESVTTNVLDATAPSKRGKEREVPKAKKPSPLKKVILKEREEKKRLRLLEDTDPMQVPSGDDPCDDPAETAAETRLPEESDYSQEVVGSRGSSAEFGTPASAEMSPISQTSPITMSPLSGSPLSSGINSPIAGNVVTGSMDRSVLMKIHSRRYREYCNQVLDKDIDVVCTQLLQDLVHFHDRLFHKDPSKAKKKRRIVLGLREVTKHLRLRKIKCVIISPNLERIQSKGGLDEALNTIIQLCTEQPVPFVFALGRRALGRACAKLVPVSVVGLFNYEGTEDQYQKLMELTEAGREAYTNMVSSLQTELADNPAPKGAVSGNVGGFQQLFPHLGHSRTPSACSAISFTSSILSEPISENYPQSEPETDSRGYEIVRPRDASGGVANADGVGTGDDRSDSPGSSKDGKITIVEVLGEIDEGHEADTEDDLLTTSPHGHRGGNSSANDGDKPDIDGDILQELPHIDSIHSIVAADLSAEIMSQHSSKTLDLNAAEVTSTHSSRTLEYGSGAVGHATPDKVRSESREVVAAVTTTNPQQRTSTLDKERIESWVAETQKQIEHIDVDRETNHDNDATQDEEEVTGSSDTDELESSAEDMRDARV